MVATSISSNDTGEEGWGTVVEVSVPASLVSVVMRSLVLAPTTVPVSALTASSVSVAVTSSESVTITLLVCVGVVLLASLAFVSWMTLGPDAVAPAASTRMTSPLVEASALVGLPDAPTDQGSGAVGGERVGSRAPTVVLGVAF